MNNPHTPDIQAIAEGLSEAQRAALLDAFDIGFAFITTFAGGRSAKALHKRGLTNLEWAPSALTRLGLQVRDYLLKEKAS